MKGMSPTIASLVRTSVVAFRPSVMAVLGPPTSNRAFLSTTMTTTTTTVMPLRFGAKGFNGRGVSVSTRRWLWSPANTNRNTNTANQIQVSTNWNGMALSRRHHYSRTGLGSMSTSMSMSNRNNTAARRFVPGTTTTTTPTSCMVQVLQRIRTGTRNRTRTGTGTGIPIRHGSSLSQAKNGEALVKGVAAAATNSNFNNSVGSSFSEVVSATTTTSSSSSSSSSSSYFGALLRRLACSLGIVYVFTEYGFEWTVCEGPSMMPTIHPRGEIVLIDRCTPRLWGIHGGDTVAERTASHQKAQERHEREQEQRLRLRQRQRLSSDNRDSDSDTDTDTTGATTATGTATGTATATTWHEPKIPVNKLPPEGAWDRLKHQLSTGISVGDVVVLQHPDRIGTVCKRVMGLPGDVVMKPSSQRGADKLTALLEGGRSANANANTNAYEAVDVDIDSVIDVPVETAPQRRRRIRRAMLGGSRVPDGHLWVEGDNPWNSSDSRNYGAVPAALIMGRVVCRLWPLRGNAILERGDRPARGDGRNGTTEPSLAFSGSVVIPAGWDDQKIVRELPAAAAAAAPSGARPVRERGGGN